MPEMDGLEATAVIREREKATGRHIPVIAMTAHAMKGDEQRCLTAGMDAYIAKPIKPDALFAVLDRHRSRDAASAELGRLNSSWTGPKAFGHVRGDAGLLRELTAIFLDECRSGEPRFATASPRSDAELVGRTAHTVKGSLGMFAAQDAYAAAEELETMARDGMLADGPAALDRLEHELAGFASAADRVREGRSAITGDMLTIDTDHLWRAHVMPKVLIVDDSPVDRRLAGKMLETRPDSSEDAGRDRHQCASTPPNGKEALDMIAAKARTRSITDLQMPGHERARPRPAGPGPVPTGPGHPDDGHGSEELAVRALHQRGASYVPKREMATDLLETVETVIEAAHGKRDLHAADVNH